MHRRIIATEGSRSPVLRAAMRAWQEPIGTVLSPCEALKIETSGNARLLELPGPRQPCREGPPGVVEEGACANLIIVDSNPLEDPELIGDPGASFGLIMKSGVVYRNRLRDRLTAR